ncbi:HEC/Ndc80p family-domain-containing protein [Syncephalis fuscata]|nr:HEC/Ndc80p family-domain-containing protein [Syncephalis fuscata]
MNRRMTLGVLDTNAQSNILQFSAQKSRPSGIPLPRSSIKRPSLAPGLERGLARQSLAPSTNYLLPSALTSAAPTVTAASAVAVTAATTVASSRLLGVPPPRTSNIDRRQSTIGRPSLGFSGPGHNNANNNNNNNNKRLTSNFARGSIIGSNNAVIQDPRPVRDKSYQQEIQASIIEYLSGAGYPHPISTNTFVARTSKDYQNMFRFLYSRLDPSFRFQKKFEEDAITIIKSICYPFHEQVNKSRLCSIGSSNHWAYLVAALHWMVELNQVVEQEEFGYMSYDVERDSPNYISKMHFYFLSQTYRAFMTGEDDFESMGAEMDETFNIRNEETIRDIERLQGENEQLLAEINQLTKNESPLSIAEKEHRILSSDKDKFIHYIKHLDNKRQKLLEINSRLADELQSSLDQLQHLEDERGDLQITVDNQKISLTDVARMTAEQEQLNKLVGEEREKEANVSKISWEQEVSFQRQADELEKLVNDYHMMAHQLMLIPETAENAKGQKFQIDLTLYAERGSKMCSVDLRKEIYPILSQLRADKKKIYHGYNDEKNLKLESLDLLGEQSIEMISEIDGKYCNMRHLNSKSNWNDRR